MTTPTPSRNDTGRIRWKQGDDRTFAVSHGYVGTIETQQFSLYEPDKNAGGSHAEEWLLTSRLAGQDRMRYDDDPGELKATAERWLSGFISSLGASFEPAVTESQRWQIEEARKFLFVWDATRNAHGTISTEAALADQVRTLLAIIEPPKGEP